MVDIITDALNGLEPGQEIIYGPGDPKNAVTCEFYMSFEKGGESLIYAKCVAGSILAPADMFKI